MPIDELLDEYWDLAYAEGQRGATTDTPSGDAQRVRSALDAAIERLLAERDEAREALRWFVDRERAIQAKFTLHGPKDTADAMVDAFARARQALQAKP